MVKMEEQSKKKKKKHARKSVLFTESTPEAWRQNNKHFFDSKIISQFCQIGKDCDQNGDRMSEKDEKVPYLH